MPLPHPRCPLGLANLIPTESKALLVTAAVITDGDRILVARRPQGKHLAGYWEFPGGKIEDGESPEECLRRELAEEFEVDVHIGEFLCRNHHTYDDLTITLLAYEAHLTSDHTSTDLQLKSHDAIRWLSVAELHKTRLAPADRPIAEYLLARQTA